MEKDTRRICIFRSPDARYYGEDILEGPDVYTDTSLAAMANHGFTGIWLRLRLRDAVQTRAFPELGPRAGEYQAQLNALIKRAASHGIRVYLYVNEPLCFPSDDPFWKRHPDVRGAAGSSGMDDWPQATAVCSSHPQVQDFLRDGMQTLFRSCSGLGGVFTITRSEHLTNCYAHHGGPTGAPCPRCGPRLAADVVAEVNNLVAEGIHAADPAAVVIAWDWGWGGEQAAVLERLRPGIAVMTAFEMGGHKMIRGRDRIVDEYSIGYAGPSEAFVKLYDWAQAHGRDLFAKLQIGTTHELATVNNLPLVPNLLAKARWLQSHAVRGSMACWNFGSRLTLNTHAFNQFLEMDLGATDDGTALRRAATRYLGVQDPAPVLEAWKDFTAAFDRYPIRAGFMYHGPVNYAVVYPLPRPGDPVRPMQWSWIPLKKPYGTDLNMTVDTPWGNTGYTLEEYRDSFQEMVPIFERGLAHYARALNGGTPEAQRELRNARAIHHVLKSTANIYTAYLLCRVQPFDEQAWRAIARDEVSHLQALLPLLKGETEIGFHSEASAWFFTADEVADKIATLQSSLRRSN